MKCKKCGHKNKRNAQFCISCGEPLENSGAGVNKLIPILLVIIIILIIAVGYIVVNNGSLNNDQPVENIVNNTTDNSTDLNEVENNTPDTSDFNEHNKTEDKTNVKTIYDDKFETIEIYGVPFVVPEGGSYRTACAYKFSFNGHECEVEEVEEHESSDSQRTFGLLDFTKSYDGGVGYVLVVNDHVWRGIKVEKDNKWFHISMKSDDDEEVMKLLDWMYERNTWDGH